MQKVGNLLGNINGQPTLKNRHFTVDFEEQLSKIKASHNYRYEAAIEQEAVPFAVLVEILAKMEKNPETCQTEKLYYPLLLDAFQAEHGAITNIYVKDPGGVALTSNHKIFIDYYIEKDSKIENLLMRCEQTATEASRLLRGKEFSACAQLIFSAAKSLLCISMNSSELSDNNDQLDNDQLDNEEEKPKPLHRWNSIKTIEKLLDYAEYYHLRAAQVRAFRYYLLGTLPSIIGIIPFLGWLLFISETSSSYPYLFVSLLGGSFGAVVSVMSRVHSNSLNVHFEMGEGSVFIAGMFRPLIGAIFAAAMYAFIESDLIPLQMDPWNDRFAFAAIGFLAGFSERWAPDMLTATGDRLLTASQIQSE